MAWSDFCLEGGISTYSCLYPTVFVKLVLIGRENCPFLPLSKVLVGLGGRMVLTWKNICPFIPAFVQGFHMFLSVL